MSLIRIRNISRLYRVGSETIHALRNVSLDIAKNEYVALMGPSGSGKSTLMNILGCLDTPTSGEYWLNGKETIVGDIASDGRTFSILSSVEVTVSEAGRGRSGCKVLRRDTARGKLSDDGAEVESFDGTLGFSYEAVTVTGSDCSGWVGTEGAVSRLPCELSYDLKAERSAEK